MFFAFLDLFKKIYDEWCQVAVVIGVILFAMANKIGWNKTNEAWKHENTTQAILRRQKMRTNRDLLPRSLLDKKPSLKAKNSFCRWNQLLCWMQHMQYWLLMLLHDCIHQEPFTSNQNMDVFVNWACSSHDHYISGHPLCTTQIWETPISSV